MKDQQSLWMKLEKTVGLQKLIALIALVVIFGFFAISSESFRSFDTAVSILDASYYIGFLAIGVTFVIITSGIDLSIGTVMMCSAIIGGVLHTKLLWLSLLAILVIGGVFGLFNGILIAKFGLPPFIATLGTMMISRGLSSIVSNVQSVTFPLRGTGEGWYKDLFRTKDNFPTGLIVLIVIAIIAAIVLNKTKIGRYIFAIGSNKEATRLSGVNVIKWEAIAGIAYAATYSTILPGTGNGMELDAIAGVVVGGTSLAGGVGSVLGTIIGVFIMSVLKIGLPYIDLQPHYQLFITGFVVIIAVYSDILIRQNKKK